MPPSSILSCLLLFALTVVESQNTSFEIDAFTPHSLLLTYERDAHVPPDKIFARLTPAYGSDPPAESVGRVLYNTPIKFWELNKQISFETTITERTTPYNTSFPYNTSTAYGWTFFIIPANSTTDSGGSSGNLGIYDTLKPGSPYFTVEFDLVINPLVDPGYDHVGININSLVSQNHTRFDNYISQLVTARITYDAPTRLISVIATYGSTTKVVSFHYNLRALLPEQVQVGLSASSGANIMASYFDFYTWHFNSTMGPDTNSLIQDDIKKYVM